MTSSRTCFSLIITFVAAPDAYEWQGYVFVVALFAINCLKSIFNVWYWHVCYQVGMRLRTAVIAIIYRKVALLSDAPGILLSSNNFF